MINANFHTKQVPSTVDKIQQDSFIKNKVFHFNDPHNQCLVYIQNNFLPLTHKIQQKTLLSKIIYFFFDVDKYEKQMP